MQNIFSRLNIVFFIELLFVVLIAIGILPREGALFLAILISAMFIIWTLEESVYFIARSIPLFLALPLTESFDNFNIWRILILIIFLKLLFVEKQQILDTIKEIFGKAKKSLKDTFVFIKQYYKIEFLIAVLLSLAILSLFKASDLGSGIKRIIYFLNLGMLFFVVRYVINQVNLIKLGKNFIVSGLIITTVGIAQLASAYLMNINDFAEFWAFTVEKNLYGNTWAQIAISANTWFAYFNQTIHLRMFSSFPDSHSFPVYLLTISIFVASFIAFKKIAFNHICPPERLFSRAGKPAIVLLLIFSLCIVLSGTRGIWVAIIAPILILIYWMIKNNGNTKLAMLGSSTSGGQRLNFRLLGLPILLFIITLLISQPIFNSKQFRLVENETGSVDQILVSRLASIFDTEEVSNQGRIYIWKESLKSIAKNPLLGVGIGNFPTVLKQNIEMARAGSSAHNLFLQILSEMGIFAFAVFLLFVYEIYKKTQALFQNKDSLLKFFGYFSVLYLAWILAYTMTDPAIFDERAFLGLMILIGAIFGLNKTED